MKAQPWKTNAVCWGLLAIFTLGLLVVNRSYHVANRRPPTFDDAWYLETSLHFYNRLTHGGLLDFLSAYASSFRTRAPLISVLPIPFYLLLGTRYHTAILVNFLFIVVTNIYLFLLGRRLFSPGVGLAAVVFYQTMPLAYGLSRVFMVDYGLATLVVAWLYHLEASERLRRGVQNFALGVLLGLGLLMKVLFPVYVAGQFLVTLLQRRKELAAPSTESRWLWRISARRPLLAIAVPGMALAATWYSFHLASIIRYAWQAGYGEIGEQYGVTDFQHWFHLVINQSMGFYYTVAVLAFGLAALAVNKGKTEWDEGAWRLASWIVIPLAAIAAGSNREIRFIVPVLPAFAILLAASIFRLARRPAWQALLVILTAAFPLTLFSTLSSHSSAPEHHGFEHPVKVGPYILFGRDLGWARPPDAQGDWDQQRIIEAIQLMDRPSAAPHYVVLGVEHPYLNANLLRYLNAYTQYPLRFTSVGYAETSVEKAVERIYSLDARFLVMPEGFHNYDLVEFLNRTNAELQARLDRGEMPFRRRAKIALHSQIGAVIYQRDDPWTRLASAAPSHPLAVDFYGGVRFLGYDWKRKDGGLGELSCYWTALHHVEEDYRVNLEFRRGGNLLLAQDHFVTGGQHPFYEWTPGEIVRQTTVVYVPADGDMAARLWLSAWGVGRALQITDPKEMIHQSMVPLRLE